MKKVFCKKIIFLCFVFCILSIKDMYCAYPLARKEDAAQYSKKSPYSSIIDMEAVQMQENGITVNDQQNIGALLPSSDNQTSSGNSENPIVSNVRDAQIDAFKATKATRSGQKYTNSWSDYNISFEDTTTSAREFYDFTDEGTVYDFALQFKDYSRLAIYYTRLARNVDEVAKKFVNNAIPVDRIVAGNTFRYVGSEEKIPFGGVEFYDYYLRSIDGKLMIIECFSDGKRDSIAASYINKITKNS